jgi:hypothetical protein
LFWSFASFDLPFSNCNLLSRHINKPKFLLTVSNYVGFGLELIEDLSGDLKVSGFGSPTGVYGSSTFNCRDGLFLSNDWSSFGGIILFCSIEFSIEALVAFILITDFPASFNLEGDGFVITCPALILSFIYRNLGLFMCLDNKLQLEKGKSKEAKDQNKKF